MKRIACESCGDVNLIKEGDFYVCQSCGSQYRIEMSLIKEKHIHVNLNNVPRESAKAARYLALAVNAKAAGNKQEAGKYAQMVLEHDPQVSIAWLLKGELVGWSMSSLMSRDRFAEVVHCFKQALKYCKQENQKLLLNEISESTTNFLAENFGMVYRDKFRADPSEGNMTTLLDYQEYMKHYDNLLRESCGVGLQECRTIIFKHINQAVCGAWNEKIRPQYDECFGEYMRPDNSEWSRFRVQSERCVTLLRLLIKQPVEDTQENIRYCKNLIVILKNLEASASYGKYTSSYDSGWRILEQLSAEARERLIDEIMECHAKIKEYDPGYVMPERPKLTNGSACYVATAVYGSYDCAPVWTLRRYRDQVLANCMPGQIFIAVYYALSPKLVRYFGSNRWFLSGCERLLNRFVGWLKKQGFDDTPYIDS